MAVSGHATTFAGCQRRICASRAESSLGRTRIFGRERDFEAFEEVTRQAKTRLPMRVLA
jgi:hypothetical protein